MYCRSANSCQCDDTRIPEGRAATKRCQKKPEKKAGRVSGEQHERRNDTFSVNIKHHNTPGCMRFILIELALETTACSVLFFFAKAFSNNLLKQNRQTSDSTLQP